MLFFVSTVSRYNHSNVCVIAVERTSSLLSNLNTWLHSSYIINIYKTYTNLLKAFCKFHKFFLAYSFAQCIVTFVKRNALTIRGYLEKQANAKVN